MPVTENVDALEDGQPAAGQQADGQQAADPSVIEQSLVEQSVVEQPVVEQQAADQSVTGQLAADPSVVEQPVIEQQAADQSATGQPAAEQPAGQEPQRSGPARAWAWVRGPHRVLGPVATVLAGVIVLLAFTTPDDISHRTWRVFVRLPMEAIIGYAVLVALPTKARRVLAVLAGIFLSMLTVVKFLDVGFFAALDRPFDLVLDWSLMPDAFGVLEDSVGHGGAVLAVVGLLVGVVVGVTLMVLSCLRLTRLGAQHQTVAFRVVAALGIVWLACSATGFEFTPGVPLADRNTATLVHSRQTQVKAGLNDKEAFAAEVDTAGDPYEDTPGSQLLTGLRGKDVILTFVESYGRSAIQDPAYATQVGAMLATADRGLKASGYSARSGWLTSSTSGGGSWLAHGSTLSGLWINNQARFNNLVSSNRLTLGGLFARAGWKTVSVEPAIAENWPDRNFFGYQKGYDVRNLGYQGPRFSYATMPDQYTLSAFQKNERMPGHRPLMAQITLLSSHTPWSPIPKALDWNDIGDGSVFHNPATRQGDPPSVVWKSSSKIKAAYRDSILYSVSTLVSYVQKYGDENLVLIFLGDHQPAPLITGAGASRDVPITIVAKDPKVLAQISGWGWTDGLKPAPDAPVWRMDAFRNKFLTAYGSTPSH